MSKYTTQVRWIVEQATPNFVGNWDSRIAAAAPKIFNFSFPIWSEDYRLELEKKILRHYFTREIGMETVGLWKFALQTKLCEIMPYYNKLYETTQKNYNYLWDTDMTEDLDANETANEKVDFSEDVTGKDTTAEDSSADTDGSKTMETTDHVMANSTDTSESIVSDFPQSRVQDKDYASGSTSTNTGSDSASDSTSHVAENSTSHGESTLDRTFNTDRNRTSTNQLNRTKDNMHQLRRTGASGSRSLTGLLQEYREALLNIDMLIINELSELFMLIY